MKTFFEKLKNWYLLKKLKRYSGYETYTYIKEKYTNTDDEIYVILVKIIEMLTKSELNRMIYLDFYRDHVDNFKINKQFKNVILISIILKLITKDEFLKLYNKIYEDLKYQSKKIIYPIEKKFIKFGKDD